MTVLVTVVIILFQSIREAQHFLLPAPQLTRQVKPSKLKSHLVSDSGGKLHGFEMTALDADGNNIGKFKAIGKTTQVIPPKDYRGLKKADKGTYVEHTSKGNKKKRWKVKWTPPASATGTVTFYAAGNEANGNGSSSGDYIYIFFLKNTAPPNTSPLSLPTLFRI